MSIDEYGISLDEYDKMWREKIMNSDKSDSEKRFIWLNYLYEKKFGPKAPHGMSFPSSRYTMDEISDLTEKALETGEPMPDIYPKYKPGILY